ncbi:hypothetical protein [Evansella tamaricis]|uniref:Uncharacterized protein n=1 Tax=Evansella tamaricis TaxID=2069301 RepID=A0ABS6JMD6_9BACI|nr:hypothetical protein [Evansella tamaricis]MBU9714841.1 hypothetical protein [Evansella tamaricis]
MPRKTAAPPENVNMENEDIRKRQNGNPEDEISKLNRLLATVLNYLSDDEVEEIDIDSLLDNTEGLREWWEKYREDNRKHMEEEIIQSLANLTIDDLESIQEKIKELEE